MERIILDMISLMFENDQISVENYMLISSTSKQLLYYFYINYSKNDKLKNKISEKYQSIWAQIFPTIHNIIFFDRRKSESIDEKCKSRFVSKNPSIMNRINNTFLNFNDLLGSCFISDYYGLSETQNNLRFKIFEVDRFAIVNKTIIVEPAIYGYSLIQNVRLLFPEDKNIKYDQFILHSDHSSMIMKEGLNNIMLPFSLCKRFEIEYIGKEDVGKIVILFQEILMDGSYPFGLDDNDYLITPHCKCDKVLTTYISGKYTRMNIDYTFEQFIQPCELQRIEKGLKFLCSEFSVEEIHCHSLKQILEQIL